MAVKFQLLSNKNTQFYPNELFPAFENLRHPTFKKLRERYQLDEVVSDIDGEFNRILHLRSWIKSIIAINDSNPTHVKHQYTFDILDAALTGGSFHCAHFSLVQSAVLNAYGYVCRRLGAGDGKKECGRYHGVNEVWVNEFAKWVLIDAKYDWHFEIDGIPLSALEMRDQVLKNKAGDVDCCHGVNRQVVSKKTTEGIEIYRWVTWEMGTNRFSAFPNHVSSASVLLDDEYSLNHVWYRDGNKNWAYDADFFIHTPHRHWIEWSPNVIQAKVQLEDNTINIRLNSCTPNFKTYQMKINNGKWVSCSDFIKMTIPEKGLLLQIKSSNFADVSGLPYKITITSCGSI